MAVIAIYSLKGGVGKTTTAFELAWRYASLSGRRTLLWDLDVQGGAAFLLDQPYPKPAAAAAAFKPGGPIRQLVRQTRYDNLHLLPADDSLRVLPNLLAHQRQPGKMAAVSALLSSEFARIVIDCPPALNEISDQIIAAADVIVVPLPPSPLAMRAFGQIRGELLNNHYRPPPLLPVLSMYDKRRRLHREVMLELAAAWPTIPLTAAIETVASSHRAVEEFAPRSPSAAAYAELHFRIEAELTAVSARPGPLVPLTPPPLPKPPPESPPEAAPQPAVPGPVARLVATPRPPKRPGWRRAFDWLARE